MTEQADLAIEDVGPLERPALQGILDESFEGWYLRHATKTLREIEVVRRASIQGNPVGLSMLKVIDGTIGYVFYVAVAKEFRRMKVGSRLLDDALELFKGRGVKEVYAAAEHDNLESIGLFASKGFVRTGYGELSGKYGMLEAITIYRKMLVVPGEILMFLRL